MTERGHQKLEVEVEAKGFKEAAKKHEDLGKAQKRLEGGVEEVSKTTKEAADSTRKLSASERDFVTLLTRVNPTLGMWADGLLKGSKITADLASQQLDLKSIITGVNDFFKSQGNLLKLLVVGGGALATTYLSITSALRGMREERERVLRTMEAERVALEALAKARAEAMGEAERGSAGRRDEGPMTAAESAAAQVVRERLAKTVPYTTAEARANAVRLAGAGAPPKDVEDLAIALDRPGPGGAIDVDKLLAVNAQSRQAAIEQLLQRRGGDITTIRATETTQRQEMIMEALRELRAQGGSTAAIQQFISGLPGRGFEAADLEVLGQIVQGLHGFTAEEAKRRSQWYVPESLSEGVMLLNPAYERLWRDAIGMKAEGITGATPDLVRLAESAYAALGRAAERLERVADLMSDEPKVYIDNRNQRNTYPDAGARQRAQRGPGYQRELVDAR